MSVCHFEGRAVTVFNSIDNIVHFVTTLEKEGDNCSTNQYERKREIMVPHRRRRRKENTCHNPREGNRYTENFLKITEVTTLSDEINSFPKPN